MSTSPATTDDTLSDVPFVERTFEMVRDHYYRKFPLLRAYDELTRKHNSGQRSINEPWDGGLSSYQITRLALIEIGKPPRDLDDIRMAEQYVRELQREVSEMYPAPAPDLADAIISAEYQWAGCVTRAEHFAAMDEADKRDHVDGLLDELMHRGAVEDHVRELLMIALPEIYARITAHSEALRNRAQLTSVQGGE
jgi:hypothetical protein